ncbi:hypothetical protein DQP56_08000 [Mycolicibacter senuensis]|nr:hypothetical protein DQP56_08000 [Mycolicibacter senuensis]
MYLVSSASASERQRTGSRRSRSAEEEASESQAAPAAAAALHEAQQRRRRRRTQQHGFGDEYMDMNIAVSPDFTESPSASDSGAGTLGFVGTVADAGRRAAGLTALADDRFGSGPQLPMIPSGWSQSCRAQG